MPAFSGTLPPPLLIDLGTLIGAGATGSNAKYCVYDLPIAA